MQLQTKFIEIVVMTDIACTSTALSHLFLCFSQSHQPSNNQAAPRGDPHAKCNQTIAALKEEIKSLQSIVEKLSKEIKVGNLCLS